MNYWIFQGRKDMYKFNLPFIFDNWGVKRFINEIKEGDKGIVWLTGDRAGCYALINIVSNPGIYGVSEDNPRWNEENLLGRKFKDEDKTRLKVKVEITHNLFKNPLLRKHLATGEDLKTIPGLEDLHVGAGYIGTNFPLKKDEYEIITNLIHFR